MPEPLAGPPEPTLEQRQLALLARSAELRAGLSDDLARLQAPLAVADTAQQGWRWLREHREAVLVGGALLALLRPRRTLRWLTRGWWLWQSARRWRPWLEAGLRVASRYGASRPAR